MPAKLASSGRKQGDKRQRRFWSDQEVQNLKDGVDKFGPGRWAQILNTFEFDNRTTVDLKVRRKGDQEMTMAELGADQ